MHGVVESVWDLLVGLVELAGLVIEVLTSLFQGTILEDIETLWDQLSELDFGELLDEWLEDFAEKWNADDLWDRWKFRGWVIGYAAAELATLYLSFGGVQALKWSGKASKLVRALAGVPVVSKTVDIAKDLHKTVREVFEKVRERFRGRKDRGDDGDGDSSGNGEQQDRDGDSDQDTDRDSEQGRVHNHFDATINYLKKTTPSARDETKIVDSLRADGLEFRGGSPDGKFKHFQDSDGNIRARIDPPDDITDYRHLHLYDDQGRTLNASGEIVDETSEAAHIALE